MNVILTKINKVFDAYKLKNNYYGPASIHIVQPPITVNLLIKRLDFFSGLFWEFVYIKPIIATIQDQLFLYQVRKGQIEFGAGYELNCSLQMEYDIERGEVKKEKYTIIKVFKVIESIPSKGDIIVKAV